MTPPEVEATRAERLTEDPSGGGAAYLSQWQLTKRKFAKHRLAVWSLRVMLLLYLVAIFAEPLAPQNPNTRDLDFQYCPPQLVAFDFTHGLHTHAMQRYVDPVTLRRTYVQRDDQPIPLGLFVKGEPYQLWGVIPMQRRVLGIDRDAVADAGLTTEASFHALGADKYGRDLLSRIIYGARISLSVGLIGVAVTFVLGVLIGGISGYAGGTLDNLIQRGIEILQSFPQLPLWIALGAIMPADWSALRVYFAITVVLALLNWTGLARVVRGKILALREEDYAVAARLLGASHGRILIRHLLPGFASHVIVALSLSVPGMILGETALSFLGLGLRPPVVSWGVLLQDCMDVQAIRYYPWLLTPVLFIIATVLTFNFVGDGLRDAADPYAAT